MYQFRLSTLFIAISSTAIWLAVSNVAFLAWGIPQMLWIGITDGVDAWVFAALLGMMMQLAVDLLKLGAILGAMIFVRLVVRKTVASRKVGQIKERSDAAPAPR